MSSLRLLYASRRFMLAASYFAQASSYSFCFAAFRSTGVTETGTGVLVTGCGWVVTTVGLEGKPVWLIVAVCGVDGVEEPVPGCGGLPGLSWSFSSQSSVCGPA